MGRRDEKPGDKPGGGRHPNGPAGSSPMENNAHRPTGQVRDPNKKPDDGDSKSS